MAAFRVLSFLLRLPHFLSLIISLLFIASWLQDTSSLVFCSLIQHPHSMSPIIVITSRIPIVLNYGHFSFTPFLGMSCRMAAVFLFSIILPFRIYGPILMVFSCHPRTSSPIYCHRCIFQILNPFSTVSDLTNFHPVFIHQQQAKCCFTH